MRRRVALVLSVSLVAVAACMDDRDRLTPPTITLTVNETDVRPGTQTVVRITAEDPNGIIYVSARLRCAETDSLLARDTDGSVPRDESYTGDFALDVPAKVPPNSALVIEALTIDDQNFAVAARDTVFARHPDVPRDQPPSAPRCNLDAQP